MPTPPSVTPNPLQGLLAPSGQPVSSGASDFQKQSESALKAWSSWAESMMKTSKSFQSDARALREAGVSFAEVEKQMKKIGLTGKHLEQAMRGYHRSLNELGELPLNQVFSDWKVNLMSLGRSFLPLLTLNTLIKTFKALDEVGAEVNKTMTTLTLQSGRALKGGGLIGGVGDSNLRGKVNESIAHMLSLGFSKDQAHGALSQAAKALPASLSGSMAPEFTKAAANISARFQLDLGKTIELLSSAMRRGETSGNAIALSFNNAINIGKKFDMSQEMAINAYADIYNSTLLFGGGLKNTEKLLGTWGGALKSAAMTIQEVTDLYRTQQELPISSVAALSELTRGLGGQAGGIAESIFGKGGSTSDRIEKFFSSMNSKEGLPNMVPLLKAIAEQQASQAGGLGPNARFDLMRSQLLPALGFSFGRQEFKRIGGAGGGGGAAGGPTAAEFAIPFNKFGDEIMPAAEASRTFTQNLGVATNRLKLFYDALFHGGAGGFFSGMNSRGGVAGGVLRENLSITINDGRAEKVGDAVTEHLKKKERAEAEALRQARADLKSGVPY